MAKRYSPRLKFQVVLELLQGDKTLGQLAKAYGVHPNSANSWKQALLEQGPEIFAQDGTVAKYERHIVELERLLDKKEMEIALQADYFGAVF